MRPTIETFISFFVFIFFSFSGAEGYAFETEYEEQTPLSSTRRIIKGRVTDTSGTPLIGATVKTKSENQGTITDAEGKFTLSINTNDILLISFIGYTGQEINTKGKSSFEITLKEDDILMDQVVVTALGIEKKKPLWSTLPYRLKAKN